MASPCQRKIAQPPQNRSKFFRADKNARGWRQAATLGGSAIRSANSPEVNHATSEIAIGSKLGIDATKNTPAKGFKREWPTADQDERRRSPEN